jgi:hypothetical protein
MDKPTQSQAVSPETPAVPASTPSAIKPLAPGSSSKIFLPVIIIVIILVIGGGLAAYFLLRSTKTTDNNHTNTPAEEETTITLDKSTYDPYETIEITYDIVEELGSGSWIGVIPADVAHGDEQDGNDNYIDWAYLYEDKSGTISLEAPGVPGEYDVRVYDTELEGGIELGSESFTVRTPDEAEVTITLDKSTYEPGETIIITYVSSSQLEPTAWFGVIPSTVEHGDQEVNEDNDIDYAFVNGETSGVVTVTAPDEEGTYDIRLNSSTDATTGIEIDYVTFIVSGSGLADNDLGTVLMVLDSTTYSPGETITLTYSTDGTLDTGAWFGLIPSDIQHGSESINDANDVEYHYIDAIGAGIIEFTAPYTAGDYDIRLNSSDSDADAVELEYVSFTVE